MFLLIFTVHSEIWYHVDGWQFWKPPFLVAFACCRTDPHPRATWWRKPHQSPCGTLGDGLGQRNPVLRVENVLAILNVEGEAIASNTGPLCHNMFWYCRTPQLLMRHFVQFQDMIAGHLLDIKWDLWRSFLLNWLLLHPIYLFPITGSTI